MRNKINMKMLICQVEKEFSLDKSVKKLADAFENKVFAREDYYQNKVNCVGNVVVNI